MKNLFLILSAIFSIKLYAGGSQVGTLSVIDQLALNSSRIYISDLSQVSNNSQIIFSKTSNTDLTEFTVGINLNNEWKLQKYIVPTDVIKTSSLQPFIEKSSLLNKWIPLAN